MIRKSVEEVSISSIQVLSWFRVKAENDLGITDTAEKEVIFGKRFLYLAILVAIPDLELINGY